MKKYLLTLLLLPVIASAGVRQFESVVSVNNVDITPTTVAASTVTITGTGAKCFSVDDPTLVVDCNLERVGIGTATPSTKLHVSAGVVTVDGSGAGMNVSGPSTATYFYGNGSGVTSLTGANVTGTVPLATALNANGANCSAGQYPLGVDTVGAVESCTAAGIGDAVLSSTQTFSGANTFLSSVTVTGTGVKCFSLDDPTMVVDCQNNRVGIGTASPSTTIDVDGNAQFGTTAKSTFSTTGALSLAVDLTVPNGGTGASTFTDGGIILGAGTGALTATSVLSNGQLLIGDGTTAPTAATLTGDAAVVVTNGAGTITFSLDSSSATLLGPTISLTAEVTGTLPVANGGTGATTLTDGGIIFGAGTGALTASSVLTNGQLLIGDGTTAPTVAALTGTGSEVEVTNGAGSITLGLPNSVTIASTLTVSGTGFSVGSSTLVVLGGNVGIRKVSPVATLDVDGYGLFTHYQGTNTIVQIVGRASTSGSLYLMAMASNDGGDNEFLFRDDGALQADGAYTSPADYAEYFYSEDATLQKGELVCVAGDAKIKRCNSVNDVLIGVVSTRPGVIGVYAPDVTDAVQLYEKDAHWVIVGLLGQVPTKVSVESGKIMAGDMLTLAAGGVAKKGESPRTLMLLALEGANKNGVVRALLK